MAAPIQRSNHWSCNKCGSHMVIMSWEQRQTERPCPEHGCHGTMSKQQGAPIRTLLAGWRKGAA